jgi:hypothetical protein
MILAMATEGETRMLFSNACRAQRLLNAIQYCMLV